MPKGDKLTNLQKRFANNILKGLNGKDAYIKAGYKTRGAGARVNASKLLTNTNIKAVIEKGQEKASDKAEITQERVLREEARLAFVDPRQLCDENGEQIPLHKLPDDIARAITGLEVIKLVDGSPKYKYKFSDKGKSLERLERHLGMFKDTLRLEMTVEEYLLKIAQERNESSN